MKPAKHPAETMLAIATGFLAIGLATGKRSWLLAALVTGIIGLFSPTLSRKIEWLWLKLSNILGYIVPNILLSVVFFVILTPLSWLSKIISGKDPLALKKPPASTWQEVNKQFKKEDLEKPW